MAITNFNTNSQRVGVVKGEILAHAVPAEVLGITGAQKRIPKNSGDTVKFRRWLPYGGATTNANTINRWSVTAAAHVVSEGVTPSVDSLTPQDITAVLEQYACLYGLTDKTFDIYEDDIPTELKKQVGERMGLVRELVRYNTLKAGTNTYFSGGTSRATTDDKISLNIIRRVARNLLANHGKQITSVLAPSPDFNTTPVEAAFLVFCHSDCEADIRDLPGFKHVSEYGQRKVIHEMEVGSCERFRFIISPELSSYADAGGANSALYATTNAAANIDVYPYIVVAEDAWGQVALRGMDSFDITWIPPGQKDKNDPLGQRGYAGAKFYQTAVILNQGHMAVIEAGVSSLT